MLAQGRASRRGLPTRQRRDRAQAEARSIAENSVSARGPQAQALAQGRRLGNTRSGQARSGDLRRIVYHRVVGRSRFRFAPVLRPEVADGQALSESKAMIDISSFLRCPISCEPLTAKDPETLVSIAGQGSLPGQAGAVPRRSAPTAACDPRAGDAVRSSRHRVNGPARSSAERVVLGMGVCFYRLKHLRKLLNSALLHPGPDRRSAGARRRRRFRADQRRRPPQAALTLGNKIFCRCADDRRSGGTARGQRDTLVLRPIARGGELRNGVVIVAPAWTNRTSITRHD